MSAPTYLRRFANWSFLIPAMLFLVSLTGVLSVSIPRTGGELIYSLDDAYIHMAMAKNLARHGVWGSTPYHFASSSSSPLWTLVLGLAYMLTGVHAVTPLILNILSALAVLALGDYYLERWGAPPAVRCVALSILTLVFPLSGMALMGMEHTFHLAATLWFAGLAISTLKEPAKGETSPVSGALYLSAALLGASRYEGLFLAALAGLAMILIRQWKRGLLVWAAALAPIALLGLYSLSQHAFFLPNSLMLKAGGERISMMAALFKLPGSDMWRALLKNPELLYLTVASLAVAALLWFKTRSFRRPAILMNLFAAPMILLHVHYAFSPLFWVYRYAAYLAAFGVLALAAGLTGQLLPDGVQTGRKWRIAAIMAVLLAAAPFIGDVREGVFPEKEMAAARKTWFEHVAAARFIAKYHGNETVMVNDLGAMGYFTEANILDIFGLGNIEPLRIRRETGVYTATEVEAWTAAQGAKIGVFQLNWAYIPPRIPSTWIKTAEIRPPFSRARLGFYAVDRQTAEILKKNLKSFYEDSARTHRYRIRWF